MACLYKRRNRLWVSYYVGGRQVQKSLHTDDERVARAKVRRLEYEIEIGDLPLPSKLPMPTVLAKFCGHLQTTCAPSSYQKDVSRLRVFFGPLCEALEFRPPGPRDRRQRPKRCHDRYAGNHVRVRTLEQVTPEVINRLLSERVQENGWSARTVNHTRELLHRLFVFAAKHLGLRSPDRRYPNPAAAVERRPEPAPEIRFLTLAQVSRQLDALGPGHGHGGVEPLLMPAGRAAGCFRPRYRRDCPRLQPQACRTLSQKCLREQPMSTILDYGEKNEKPKSRRTEMILGARKLIVICLVGAVFLIANAMIVADWLEEKGVVDFAGGIRKDFLTGTAITIIVALLILLVRPRAVRATAGRWFGRCPVCDHRLIGGGSYCSECGSRT